VPKHALLLWFGTNHIARCAESYFASHQEGRALLQWPVVICFLCCEDWLQDEGFHKSFKVSNFTTAETLLLSTLMLQQIAQRSMEQLYLWIRSTDILLQHQVCPMREHHIVSSNASQGKSTRQRIHH
jgi:hypothetical protein